MQAFEFIDECTVYVRAGDGGDGVASFRREAHVPRGGPNGGDGGNGGSVILVADPDVTSLIDLHRRPHCRADAGEKGGSSNRTGHDGDPLLVSVPVGTIVRDDRGNELVDLQVAGSRQVVARGGRGGRGNTTFANRYRRAPKFAEFGEKVHDVTLHLELKLIADVGLVGYPSSGKSSLISRLSAARPKVAEYPFTTLTPNLGVLRIDETDLVIADVPGLVAGASEGRGLGHQFLRHVERCSAFVHVVDTFSMDGERNPIDDLATIKRELRAHRAELADRPAVVALNKIDVPEGREVALAAMDQLQEANQEVFLISAVTGEGLDDLSRRLAQMVVREAADYTDVEVVIRHNAESTGFDVVKKDPGSYAVVGQQVERWVQMSRLDNEEALRYLQGRLRRAGVDRRLAAAGARKGDEVVIGEVVFEFEPELDDLSEDEREAVLAGELDLEARALEGLSS